MSVSEDSADQGKRLKQEREELEAAIEEKREELRRLTEGLESLAMSKGGKRAKKMSLIPKIEGESSSSDEEGEGEKEEYRSGRKWQGPKLEKFMKGENFARKRKKDINSV